MTKGQIRIFCDFDGTITKGDTTDLLLDTLADPYWQVIEKRWENGEISGRQCMAQQVPLIKGGFPAILKVLDKVELDETFTTFINWCKLHGIKISIVSDGIDKVINHLLKRERINVDVEANHLIEHPDGSLSLTFPGWGQVVCPSGLCKCQVLQKSGTNVIKVIIGDGRSDFCWAHKADLLFAKDKLLKYCRQEKISCLPFDNFWQIRMMMDTLITSAQPSASQIPAQLSQQPLLARS
jgi:2-hydroxy-3-keto-5-methylthiopentenyl-1-phosphate phosphatase